MDDELTAPGVGALALVGSGEYTPAMSATDAALLATIQSANPPRVVVLPTAAGREPPASPERWARMGIEHFQALGAEVEAAMILNGADAANPRWLPLLEAADFYYFSGGDPGHVVETMADSPAWAAIRRRYLGGAVLAGCSAGAMAFGGWTIRRPGLGHGTYRPGLGVVPHLITIPHFDQSGRWIPAPLFAWLRRNAPSGTTILGVDEDTALVRAPVDGALRWVVQGRQTVTVFGGDDTMDRAIYQAGDEVPLPLA